MMITFGDFMKLDIRVGTVKSAERVEGADKLMKLTMDMGPGDESRQLVAGIAEWYPPEDLVGKQIPVLVNLEPKEFRGVQSQGMILAADEDGTAVLLHPGREIKNGGKVR
jgi:methionine--tRNA ligase beta chain